MTRLPTIVLVTSLIIQVVSVQTHVKNKLFQLFKLQTQELSFSEIKNVVSVSTLAGSMVGVLDMKWTQ